MGNKHSKSRRQSKVTVDNQRQKPQDVPPPASPNDERPAKSKGNEDDKRHEKLSTKTSGASVGLMNKNSEQQPSTDVTAGSSISKGPPSNAGRLPPPKEQRETNQAVHARCGASSAAPVAGVGNGNTRSSSSGRHNQDVPLPASANATNGYISFSESESDMSASSPAAATTAGTPVKQRSTEGGVPHNDGHDKLAADGGQEEIHQDRPADHVGAKSDDGGGDDMWDFGDEDSDEEQALGSRMVATATGQHQQGQQLINISSSDGLVVVPQSLSAGIGGSGGAVVAGNDGSVDEPPQARVVVDRLGRRENAPRR